MVSLELKMQLEILLENDKKTRNIKFHRRQQKSSNNLAVDEVFIKLSPALTFIMSIKNTKMQRRGCCQVLDEKLSLLLCVVIYSRHNNLDGE